MVESTAIPAKAQQLNQTSSYSPLPNVLGTTGRGAFKAAQPFTACRRTLLSGQQQEMLKKETRAYLLHYAG